MTTSLGQWSPQHEAASPKEPPRLFRFLQPGATEPGHRVPGRRPESRPFPGCPRHATVDPDRICRTWATNQFGIAIACGPSGLIVLDTDTANPTTAENTIATLASHDTTFPSTWTVSAPTGGLHRYYTNPHHLTSTTGTLGPYINTRGTHDYVIAPPTATTHGPYITLIAQPVAPLPDWLALLLTDE